MDDDIRALASARAEVDALEAELAEFESQIAIRRAQLKKRIKDMVEIRGDFTDSIRQDAIENYQKTGHTRPHPAVSVYSHPLASLGAALDYPLIPDVRIKRDLSAYLVKEEEGA